LFDLPSKEPEKLKSSKNSKLKTFYVIGSVAASLILSVAAVLPYIDKWFGPGGEPVPPGGATPGDTVAATTPDEVGSDAIDPDCRADWEKVGPVEARPCIEATDEGIAISVRVRMVADGEPPGYAVVWMWLMDTDPELIDRLDETRDASTLRRCELSFNGSGEVQVCGPETVVPPGGEPGVYTTAMSAQAYGGQLPPGWEETDFAGTQAIESVTWV
jgi:hypothetical protein